MVVLHVDAHDHVGGHFKSCKNPEECSCTMSRHLIVLGITISICLLEIVGARLSGSLALFADAGHVASDAIAIILSMVVLHHKRTDESFHQNQEHVDTFVSRIQMGLLVLLAGWILFEGYKRYQEPEEVSGLIMLMVAGIGGVGNYIQHKILDSTASSDMTKTQQGLSLHILSDLVQSIGVVVGGLLIMLTGVSVIDLIISSTIAIWLLWQVYKMWKHPSEIFHHH